MYLVNRWRVTTPVLGMIDEIAEGAGYWPVPAKKNAKAVKIVEPPRNRQLARARAAIWTSKSTRLRAAMQALIRNLSDSCRGGAALSPSRGAGDLRMHTMRRACACQS